MTLTRETLEALDAQDPLAHCRDRFDLPDNVVYLDGNSLGALVKSVAPRMAQAVQTEWGRGLIRSWNEAGWYPAPLRVGDRIAQLIGANAGEVAVCDSISVNLFKVLVAALRMRSGRRIILSEEGNFPTDRYIASGVAELMQADLVCVAPEAILSTIESLGQQLAVVTLTHVNYKTGRVYDMPAITAAAHRVGALVNWDLAHSAGTLPVRLNDGQADFAVGCGYKYLNGGPGSPAFVFAAARHHDQLQQPITGWHGHARPFDFSEQYEPHAGIDRMLVGTAPQLSLIALEEALTAFDGVDLMTLRHKGSRLGDLFIALLDQELPDAGFTLACPRDAQQRGSQVSFHHPDGYAIVQALIARGIIGDFRAPDILRFGFAGLYVRYVDVWDAVATLKSVMRTRAWDTPEFTLRKAVT